MDEEHRQEILAAMRADYEGRILRIADICERYHITRRRLYQIANAEGWQLRSPRRIDKHDLAQRLLRLLERQVARLEESMRKTPTDQSVVLSKVSATLDRLIATHRQTAPAPRASQESKLMREIRDKVAQRLSQLNGD